MDGVVILDEYNRAEDYWFCEEIGIGGLLLYTALIFVSEGESGLAIFFAVLSILFFAVAYFGYVLSRKTFCKAIVDPSVSATDLLDHYEVVGRKGDIWTLKALEEVDEL